MAYGLKASSCDPLKESTPLNKLAVADSVRARMLVDDLNMTFAYTKSYKNVKEWHLYFKIWK